MSGLIISAAVDVGSTDADKRYEYRVPDSMAERVKAGVRILVPFGRSNRSTEAVILEVKDSQENPEWMKSVETVLDTEPALDMEQLKLAIHMRNRLFCPLYTIVRTMLPAGYWFKTEQVFVPAQGASVEDAMRLVMLIPGGDQIIRTLFEAKKPVSIKRLRSKFVYQTLESVLSVLLENGLILSQEIRTARTSGRMTKLYEPAYGAELLSLRSETQRQVLDFLLRSEPACLKDIQYFTGASESVVRSMERSGTLHSREVQVPTVHTEMQYAPQELVLNEEQQAAYDGLKALADKDNYRTALLQGVTGSGKTLVYMSLIENARKQGKGAMLLVPEIALTPQMLERFYRQFGDDAAVLHSALSVTEKYKTWQRIRAGQAGIVIGTRSAVFAPVQNLGLIIIDEEHERSYRSDTEPRYHAREAAQYRCWQRKALLVLGSATPTVETAWRARQGEYDFFRIDRRYGGAELPYTLIVDQKKSFREGYTGTMTGELLDALGETLSHGKQAILFLNRRGTSRQIICMSCGHVIKCKNCSVAMSYHGVSGRLMCHQCGYSMFRPEVCPECGQRMLAERGFGTQAVEQELLERFPELRVLRMDSDTTNGKNSHDEILAAFRAHEADVLVGTQMVAKGLDFANVTLVGVIDADVSLYGTEYTCAEETFALLTQVIGRSGRGADRGTAVIQTSAPQSEVIAAAAAQNYDDFYEDEIKLRRALRQPPFVRMLRIWVSGKSDDGTYDAGKRLKTILEALVSTARMDCDVLGPAAAAILKINNCYRYTVTLRTDENERLDQVVAEALRRFGADPANRKLSVWTERI